MENSRSHTAQSPELDTRSLVRAIDDWIAKERKIIAAGRKIKRRFVREMVNATASKATEAEDLFETLMQSRRAQADMKKRMGPAREYAHLDRKNFHKLRATYAWAAIHFGKSLSSSKQQSTMCVRGRSDTSDCKANHECTSCQFRVDGSPHRIVGYRQRDND